MKILYLCNKKKKCSGCGLEGHPCKHTLEIRFAKNYKRRPTRSEKEENFIRLSDEIIIEKEEK